MNKLCKKIRRFIKDKASGANNWALYFISYVTYTATPKSD
jgi:hypothetical protein